MKYNSDVWCRDADNYADLLKAVDQNGNYKSFAHYFFTLMNVLTNSAALICTTGLGQIYQRKELVLVKSKLRP